MPYVVNGTPAAQKWVNFDKHAELKSNAAGQQVVDHAQSARENLKQAGKDFVNIFDPTNHFRDLNRSSRGDFNFAPLFYPWALMFEVGDVLLGPVRVAKNLTDAAAHGVMAGVQAMTGKE